MGTTSTYAERPDSLGAKQRVAVECKHWSKVLTQADVSAIFASYHPLIESYSIDIILLVTSVGIAPSAETFVSTTRYMRHLTHAQLLNTLIDFRVLLTGLVADYETDPVSRYYVPQGFVQGEGTIEDYLLEWISSNDQYPIAVLGGYGLGKTTLAKRIAFLLASRWLKNPLARIPVVIPLATIAAEQTLEGLLGRQFTSDPLCPNYNFHLFKSLNARGRFVILLDGFDEMKKTMSWESLQYNLAQLNQLVTPMSKVVLLGRPSAFLSSDEHDEALHGKVRSVGMDRRVLDWPDYKEIELRPFSRLQVALFIEQFLATLPGESLSDVERRRRVEQYLASVQSPQGKRLLDLASRPVQLKMLVELLPEYTGPIDRLTIAVLYSEFIDLLLRRELTKPARAAFRKEQRLRFASRLAYWMWLDNQRTDIDLRELPDALFDGYLDGTGRDIQVDDIKRDLLSGGFLDRKPPSVFYFPHRSFQEYLVAEHLRFLIEKGDATINQCPFLTPEATSFVIELIGKPGIIKLRKQWSQRTAPSEVVRDLINCGCAHYGLDLLDPTGEHETEEIRKSVSEAERAALLRKLEVVGVLHLKTTDVRRSASKTQGKSKHKSKGVLRKRNYRSR